MKKIILFICVIAATITLNSCNKCTVWYAYCETGHASWKGPERESCQGERAESQMQSARMDADGHDINIHGGIGTAIVRSEYK